MADEINRLFKVEDTEYLLPSRPTQYMLVSFRPGKQWWSGWQWWGKIFDTLDSARIFAEQRRGVGDMYISIWKLPGTEKDNG